MATATRLKRKSYFVDEVKVRKAKKVLKVSSEAEAVRLAVDRILEMEKFWRFMDRTRRKLMPGSFGSI